MDVRLVERNIRKGLISREQYEAYINSLPDLAEDGEAINVDTYRQEVENTRVDSPPKTPTTT